MIPVVPGPLTLSPLFLDTEWFLIVHIVNSYIIMTEISLKRSFDQSLFAIH